MEVIERIITAINYGYTGGKISATTLYFNDGTSLELDGHWEFKVGETYRIAYTNGNPVTVSGITMLA